MRRATTIAIALGACGDVASPADGGLHADTSMLACGAGTIEQDGVCIAAGRHFEIRISETELGANGRTRRRIVAFGTENGRPITERVVVGIDRASAGSFDATDLTLGTYGATTHFTPCLATDAECLGPATLTLALASAPQDIVATAAISLVPATNVSTIAPCVDFPTKLYLDGNDFITSTIFEAEDGEWTVSHQFSNSFSIGVVAGDLNLGRMNLIFESIQIAVPLAPGIFEEARRASSRTPGHPGLDITGNGRACNMLGGRFQIHAYTRDTVSSELEMIVSFEQHCEFAPELTEGCLRYKP